MSDYISVSTSAIPGLCVEGKKCLRRVGHPGSCWPSDTPTAADSDKGEVVEE